MSRLVPLSVLPAEVVVRWRVRERWWWGGGRGEDRRDACLPYLLVQYV
jgi:hypothetical protein